MKKADIGLIGLAVMGENLVMNMESRGFTVAVYNRSTGKVDKFVSGRAAGKNIIGCHSPEELVSKLEKPRKVFMMVKAGKAVDELIERLVPLLEEGDDFVLLHLEAPDDLSHLGDRDGKVESIRRLDSRMVGPVLDALTSCAHEELILWGEEDKLVPIDKLFALRERIKTGVYYSLRNVGHWMHEEKAEMLAEIIDRYIQYRGENA